jgi:hypothetical protein
MRTRHGVKKSGTLSRFCSLFEENLTLACFLQKLWIDKSQVRMHSFSMMPAR